MEIRRIIEAVAAAVGAAIGIAFQGWSWTTLHTILVMFMVVDYISGVIVALLGLSPKTEGGKLSSKAGFIGLAKKVFIIFFVFIGAALDSALKTNMFQSMVLCMYIANEGISIIENATILGVPIPKAIKDALEIMRKKGDGEEPVKKIEQI